MNTSGYTIGRIFSQVILDDSSQWHSVNFFSQKIILAKIRYKIYNGELLAIIKTFKTWRYYLKGF